MWTPTMQSGKWPSIGSQGFWQLTYPAQFTLEACKGAFSFWPQDVRRLEQQHAHQLIQLGGPCLVWAGWEC